MEKFNLEEFKKLFSMGDLLGLDYIERTIITDMVEKNMGKLDYTRADYIYSLFRAVVYLNSCNSAYETIAVASNFRQDLYFETRNLLFEELGIDISELRK